MVISIQTNLNEMAYGGPVDLPRLKSVGLEIQDMSGLDLLQDGNKYRFLCTPVESATADARDSVQEI